MKIGVGRLFEPKTRLGEREAIVSTNNLKVLKASVGDNVTLYYDIKLILNMIQNLSGQILPTFLTKETKEAELQNEERRNELAWEMAEFFVDLAG